MVIGLAYAKDFEQAFKLLKWIGFLSEKDGFSMQKETIILVPSLHAQAKEAHAEFVSMAEDIFLNAHVHALKAEDERGWPQSCNFMFSEALQFVEEHLKDDMLWLEPDAIPIVRDWYSQIQDEYGKGGKPFMGSFVPGFKPHMTGIAVYGKDWRQLAPELVQNTPAPWDVYSSEKVVPIAHFTNLIQHVNRKPNLTSIENLDPKAVIYHQDKVGKLIEELDNSRFGGECVRHPKFKHERIHVFKPMKFYVCENARAPKAARGFKFQFEITGEFGGTWEGAFSTANEDHIIALDALCMDPKSSVREITQQEWEAKTKKKAIQPGLPGSANSKPEPVPSPPSLSISAKAGVVVENPLPSPEPDSLTGAVPIANIKEVLKVGSVPFTGTPDTNAGKKNKGGRPKKT